MTKTKLYLQGHDISEFIQKYPALRFGFGDYGEFPQLGNLTLQGDNTNGFWNPDNPASIFYSRDFYNWELKIKDSVADTVLYSGLINSVDIQNNGRQANINLISRLNKFLDKPIPFYNSNELLTPAEILEEMCVLWDVPYNETSIDRSHNIQSAAGLFINADINYEHNLTLINAFKLLCDIGVARMFIFKDELYYHAYDRDLSSSTADIITVDEKYLLKIESLKQNYKSPLNGYKIITTTSTFTGGDEDSNDSLKSVDLSSGKPFSMSALNGAYHIGESYLELSKKNFKQATVLLDREFAMLLTPSSFIYLENETLFPEGQSFEVLSIDLSSNLFSRLELRTID